MKNKKLFIIGAGASKDIDNEMPLGNELLYKLKGLGHKALLELIIIGFLEFQNKHARIEIDLVKYVEYINKIVDKYLYVNLAKDTYISFKEDSIINILSKILEYDQIKEFYTVAERHKILNDFTKIFFNKHCMFLESINQLLELILERFIFDKDTLKKLAESIDLLTNLINFAVRHNVTDQEKDYEVLNHIVAQQTASTIMNSLQKELNIPEDLPKYATNTVVQYVIKSIILSKVLAQFGNSIYSIDCLMSCFSSITAYTDELATKYNLSEVSDIKQFALEQIAHIVPSNFFNNIYFFKDSYLQIINKTILDRKVDFNDIKFINFNYDHFIEMFFTQFDYVAFKCNLLEKAGSYIDFFQKSHVYNTLPMKGYYYNILYKIGIERKLFNTKKEPTSHIPVQATFIRTDFKETEIGYHFSKIKESDDIYILGFGFDKWNLHNIGLLDQNYKRSLYASKLKKKNIYITNYGDLPRVRLIIEEVFNVRLYRESETEEVSEDGKKIIKYSFWRSHKKDKNKVFVSTKPVYKALKEDFNI